MKKIVCEMCGSSNVAKKGDMFVCSDCGMQYDLDAARGLMVEVTGTVEVKNQAQIENLIKMAKLAYESKNYKQAESQCDQILSMDASNYEIWKLKGEAINYQINADNPRILEVYNCIINSYRVLDDAAKEEHKLEILKSLQVCLEEEIEFWLKVFEDNRPSSSALTKVKNTLNQCIKLIGDAFDEMGLSKNKEDYKIYLINYFIKETNSRCVSAWKTTVGYNYYRDAFSTLGKNWKSGVPLMGEDESYHPTDEIWRTFITETDIMVELLNYAISLRNEKTNKKELITIMENLVYFQECMIAAKTYKPMIQTKTNAFNVRVQKRYWDYNGELSKEAKNIRRGYITEYNSLKSKFEAEQRAIEEAERKRIQAEKEAKEKAEKEAAEKRYNDYWEAHKEEKENFLNEKAILNKEVESIKTEIETLPAKNEISALNKQISELITKKNSLGLFKGKEKKAIEEQVAQLNVEVNKKNQEYRKGVEQLNAKITPLLNRIKVIDSELNKAR